MRSLVRLAALLAVVSVGGCRQSREAQGGPMSQFVDQYFDAYLEWNPSSATSFGFHQYDDRLEDYSAAAFQKRIGKSKQLQSRIASLPATRTPDEAIDAGILDDQIRAELLDLETLQTWRHNPMNYVSLPGGAIDNLMKRNFAPPAERLRSVVARLKAVPPMIAAMKQNVDDPPHEFTDLAFRIAHGSVGFFKASVANWAKDAGGNDTSVLQEFNTANDAAANSLEDAAGWLEKTLLP